MHKDTDKDSDYSKRHHPIESPPSPPMHGPPDMGTPPRPPYGGPDDGDKHRLDGDYSIDPPPRNRR